MDVSIKFNTYSGILVTSIIDLFVLVASSSFPCRKRNTGVPAGEVPQQAEIEKAAEAASANDFIQKLEEKYQSMIGR